MNFLLYQPALLSEPDKVYLNGTLLEDTSKRREVYDTIVSLFNSIGTKTYPWFGKAGDFYVLRGLFDAKDEKGRTLSFLFASDNVNYQEELTSISKTIGYNVDSKTWIAIDDFSAHREKIKSIIKYVSIAFISIVFSATLITIIFILCKRPPTY